MPEREPQHKPPHIDIPSDTAENVGRAAPNVSQEFSEEAGSPEPFVIRGHHVSRISQFLNSGKTPTEYAHEVRTAYVGARRVARLVGLKSIRDTVGDTREQEDAFEESFSQYLQKFTELVDDHPIQVVAAGEKDGICASCAFGKHCEDPRNKHADAGFIDLVTEKVPPVGDAVELEEGIPTRLTLSAGDLRDAAGDMQYSVMSQYRAELKYRKLSKKNEREKRKQAKTNQSVGDTFQDSQSRKKEGPGTAWVGDFPRPEIQSGEIVSREEIGPEPKVFNPDDSIDTADKSRPKGDVGPVQEKSK